MYPRYRPPCTVEMSKRECSSSDEGVDAQSISLDGKIGEKMAPYNPTDPAVISIAINFLQLRADDIVYDLGCGDGRFVIEASVVVL